MKTLIEEHLATVLAVFVIVTIIGMITPIGRQFTSGVNNIVTDLISNFSNIIAMGN